MSDPTVGTVGRGPAAAAARTVLEDGGVRPTTIEATAAGSVDLAVVVARTGTEPFEQVNAERDGPWLAVELGGVGGLLLDGVTASVAVLRGSGPCYACLRTRVRSVVEEPPSGDPAVAAPDARLAGAHAGRLALDVLADADGAGSVVELPYAKRRLWPVPGCACDGRRPSAPDRDYAAIDLEATVARAERAVDPRFGPVVTVGEAESFPAAYYLAELCDTRGFSDGQASRHAAGVAADWNPAFVKAIGEGLERYAAGLYHESSFDVAPAAELDDAVSPDRFVAPAGSDVPAQEAIAWVPGEHLATGRTVRLPAERVHFPPPTERLGPAITTGLGLGSSGIGALVSGLTEVIERDATMLAWYSTYEPLGLTVDDPRFAALVRRARAEDLSVTPLLVTQDVDVPVITAAVHREGDWPLFAVGSGAGLDPDAVATAALEEALQNWMELRGMGPERAAEEEPRIARYATFPPEARRLVDDHSRVPATRVGPDEVPRGADALDVLIDRAAAAGLDPYASRLTTRDVEAAGFEVVRVVIPEAQPLFTGERFFGERARSVPRTLGFRPRLDRQPHPYP